MARIYFHLSSADKASANILARQSKSEVHMRIIRRILFSSLVFVMLILGLSLVLLPREVAAQGGPNDPISDIPFPRIYWFDHDCHAGDWTEPTGYQVASIYEMHADCAENGLDNTWNRLTIRPDSLTNRWSVNWDLLNLAFVPGWYTYGYNNTPLTDHHKAQVYDECADNWLFPLDSYGKGQTGLDYVHWKDRRLLPLYAANLGTEEDTQNTITCDDELYVDWWPNWITNTAVTDNKWDGIRIDMNANIHQYYYGRVDHDGNGTKDSLEQGGWNLGRRRLNELYRTGIEHMLENLPSNWIVAGVDAWHPAGGSAYDNFDTPGFANGQVDIVIAENWTKHWHASTPEDYISWPNTDWVDPEDPKAKQYKVDFSTAVKIWHEFDKAVDPTKHYVIMSKQITDGISELLWEKERRFSLAAATALGAVHSYASSEVHSTWVDEYAVYPDNEIATTTNNRIEGMGWLGFPRSSMMTVDSEGALSESISTTVNSEQWTTIKDKVWVRYFDHGVVLLNPTEYTTTTKLVGHFQRLDGSSAVNNGNVLVENPTVPVPARDGLFLYDTCRAMDFDDNGKIDIVDLGMIAARWEDPDLYEARFDVAPLGNPDGVINIADISVVAARVVTDCSPVSVQ
ncbi:MAG: hypothetical protein GY759_01345 [Chloroflexi bacterium]|nr:hypothetical protein [Chloroflexota bacterium]